MMEVVSNTNIFIMQDTQYSFHSLNNFVPSPNFNVETEVGRFWETLEADGLVTTKRAKVPGGWLVQQFFVAPVNKDSSQLGTMTFVADPNHQWHIKKEFK